MLELMATARGDGAGGGGEAVGRRGEEEKSGRGANAVPTMTFTLRTLTHSRQGSLVITLMYSVCGSIPFSANAR